MKTFKQILDQIYSQPEFNEVQDDFTEYTVEQKNAVIVALDEICEEFDYPFKEVSTAFNTVIGTSSYDLPYGKLKDKGLKVSGATRPLDKVNNFDNMIARSGMPYYYSVESNKLNLYPTPDAVYSIGLKYYSDYKAVNTLVAKDTLELEDDILNVPDYIESHFIITLGYKTVLNKTADPTEEIYVHAQANYDRALALLKNKSNRSTTGAQFII